MITQHTPLTPELMSENTITTLHKSHAHKPSFFHIITIMMTVMMWVWGECAWAEFRNFHLVLAKGDAECLVTEAEFATQYTPVEFGYVVNNDGTVRRVEKDDPTSMGTIKGKSHSEHGITNFEMTVNVDGGVKVGMGTCNWGGDVKINGATSFNTSNSDHCWHTDKVNNIAYGHYVGGAGTITISGGSYTAYVSVEAETVTTHRVSFSLGSVVCEGTLLPVGSDVVDGESFTIPKNFTLYKEGNTLTGWTDGTNTYNIGDDFTPTADVTLNPVFRQNTKALDDRTSAVTLLWDFQRNNGAPTVNVQGGSGIWVIQANVNGESIDVKMEYDATSGKLNNANRGDWCQINEGTKLTFPSCKDATVTAFVMNNLTTTTIGGSAPAMSGNNASVTITSSNSTQQLVAGNDIQYIRTLTIVLPVVASPTPSGIYDATVTTVAELKTALAAASGTSRYKIFIKNGTYNLGTDYDTKVKDYTTLIGESRDGVIIENHPATEGIWTSATLSTGSNVVMQNLTLHSIVELKDGAERGTSLYDDGSNNVYKNIRLLGRQDTYYSSNDVNSYFEDCEIHGTVDFICGGGNAWFEKCQILLEDRSSADVIVAPRDGATNYKGYFFNNCTIDNAEGANMNNNYYLGRGWEGHPKSVFANCTYKIAPKADDGYNRTDWAHGAKNDADDNSGMTKQDAALTNASTTMGTVATAVQPLPAPASISLDGSTLTWSAVDGASAYAVYRDNTLLTITTETSYDVSAAARTRNSVLRKTSGSTGDNYSVAAISDAGIMGDAGKAKPNYPITATWDFTKSGYPASGIEKTNATLKANTGQALEMDVIASNDGKLSDNGSTAQFNQNTELHIPVISVNDEITVTSYVDASRPIDYVSVGGKAMSTNPTLYKPSKEDVIKGYVIVKAEGNTYIKSVAINQNEPTFEVVYERIANWSWKEKNPASITETNIQGKTGTVASDIDGVLLNVDATSSGKLQYNASGYAQFNNGTIIKVPVRHEGDKVTIEAYPGQYNYTVAGTAASANTTNYVVTKEDAGKGYIEIVATNTAYINSISVQQKGYAVENRTFTDFKINFTGESTVDENKTYYVTSTDANGKATYTSVEPASYLASFKGRYHGTTYGITGNPVITIPVDGPVKIYYGTNDYGADVTVKNSDGETVGSMNTNGGKWNASNPEGNLASVVYNSETPTVLTLSGGGYIPFIKVEACDLIPQVTVTYYNTDGTTIIGKESVTGSSALAYKYGESDVTVPAGSKFRGWFDRATGGKKVPEGETLNANLSLYAIATPIETATLGSTFTYDLTASPDFYFEDHELITNNAGTRNGSHGYQYNEGKSLSVQVAGNAKIILGGCIHANDAATIVATSPDGGTFTPFSVNSKTASCDASMVFDYVGPATTVTLTSTGGTSYIHHVQVINEAAVVIKMASTKDKVTINNNVAGATVYYTLDGSTPTTSSDSFTDASKELPITGNTWVKTLLVKDGMEDIATDYFCRVSFVGFAWKLGQDPFLGTDTKVAVSTGVIIDDTGNKHLVPLGDPSSSIDITTTYHDSQHGYIGLDATVPVEGPVRIMIGDCKYANGSITITDGDGNTVATIEQVKDKDACYDASKNTGFKTVLYEGEATVLSFKGTGTVYVPFLSVVDASTPVVTFVNRYPKTIVGTVPAEVEVNEARKAYIPQNTTLYREGWTIAGWTDDEKVYPLGEWAEFTKNTTLFPVMQKCENAITDANSVLNVTWPFDLLDGAPDICLHNKNSDPNDMIYVSNVQVNGAPVDVPLIIDASNGKVDNTDTRVNALKDAGGNAAKGGQLNDGTVLTVPAVYGMTVTLNASNKVDTDSRYDNNKTHFGSEDTDAVIELYDVKGGEKLNVAPTITNNGKSISFTYTGDATSLDLLLKKTGSSTTWGFFTDITVSYPVLPDVVTTNVITTAKLSANELDKNAGQVVIKTKTSVGSHPNTGNRYKVGEVVTITATPEYGYDITGFRLQGASDNMTGVTNGDNGAKLVDFTVVDGITNIEVLYARKTMYKVTVKTADKALGTVELDPKYDNFYSKNAETGDVECYYTEGTSVTALSEGASGYVIESWNEGTTTGTQLGTNNAYTFTVATTERVIVASFKKGEIGSVTFDISVITPNDKHVDGYNSPATNYNDSRSIQPTALSNVRSFTVPTNFTFFKNNGTDFGYTLKYWTDASGNRYELGKVYSFTKANEAITLKPVFELNPASQLNRLNNPIIHYEFGTGSKIYTDKTESFINPGVIVGDKKVAAQQVNIGSNQNFFWTSQVYTEVLDNGLEKAHTRDVAMWVETGDKGFFRNGDLDDWAAFGPGTTFWFASGAGSKVSIMTYAPITTTTIDGIVPILDTDDPRCNPAEHKYVYSLIVDNPTLRIPIVIGDDYSYYQWIETATLAANMVNLHADVDDDARASITEIATESQYGSEELEDGGYSFHQGDRVRIKFQRKFGFDFDKIIDPDRGIAVLEMLPDDKVRIVTSSTDATFEELPLNADGQSWGDNTHLFSLKKYEAKADYTMNDADRTIYEVEFDITTHRRIEICFKEKKTYYITFNAGQLASGSAPAANWVEAGDKYLIPYNNTLYYEGNTLDYWYDESDQHYVIGSTDNVAPASDLRLFPHFSPNAFSLLDAEGTATWPLATKAGAPAIAFERSKGILVTQLYNDDRSKWIDLKVDLDASDHIGADGKPEMKDGRVIAGKFNNQNYDDRCQINQYSIITFPSSKGCVISMNAMNDVSSTTVAGKNKGESGYTAYKSSFEVTYDGDDARQKAEFNQSNLYATDFSVTYKKQDTQKPTLQSLKVGDTALTDEQLSTLKTNKSLDVTVEPYKNNELIPSITGTATNGGVVKATGATVELEAPQSTVTVWTKENDGFLLETYTINFKYGTPSDAPRFVKYIVNGIEKNTSTATYNDVPVSGIVQVVFDRTMQSVTVPSTTQTLTTDTYSAKKGKVLEFRYWNLPAGGSTTLNVPGRLFKDIYGAELTEDLSLTLNVKAASSLYEHRTFDYVVGTDGDMDGAVAAANAATGTDRYYVFIPDGEYKLTGNEEITPKVTSDGMAPADNDGVNREDLLDKPLANGMTRISRANISLIGQSREGVLVYNKPTVEGISYTATLHAISSATDFYVEDLTLENTFDYKRSIANQEKSAAARAVVFQSEANKSVMKNVALKSYQDTYFSNGSNDDYRGYFENCQLWGVVDWLCGNGDIWFEKCDMVIRDRSGNNLAAPRTSAQQQWGYVLNQCSIIKEPGISPTELADKTWTLARPWNASPACTFLSNKMEFEPRQSGWGTMGSEMLLRFHEYNTTDLADNPLSLGTRSLAACSPAAGSDDCVLNESQAKQYTVHNALGGGDAFDPQGLTRQIDAKTGDTKDENTYEWNDDIEVDDDRLQWNTEPMALCYFVFKKDEGTGKWLYITNIAQSTDAETVTGLSLERYGDGIYCVRAANQRGGLGAPTKEIDFKVSEKYTLEIKKAATVDGVDYGWSTICLPYNSKVPTIDINGDTKEGFKVYAANGVNPNAASENDMFDTEHKNKVTDYYLYLKSVSVINKDQGYVVYGPVGQYQFASSSHTSDVVTILNGNSDTEAIPTGNNNGYVLANKSTYGVGFYKYTGGTLAANRAWLPVDMVDNKETNTPNNVGSTAFLRLVIVSDDENTAIDPVIIDHPAPSVIYDLMGTRILTPTPGRIYIVDGKKVLWR